MLSAAAQNRAPRVRQRAARPRRSTSPGPSIFRGPLVERRMGLLENRCREHQGVYALVDGLCAGSVASGWRRRRLAPGLERGAEPVFDLALVPDQRTVLVLDPAFGRLPRELAVPLADRGIAGRAADRHPAQPRRPVATERRILDAAALAATKHRHRSSPPSPP